MSIDTNQIMTARVLCQTLPCPITWEGFECKNRDCPFLHSRSVKKCEVKHDDSSEVFCPCFHSLRESVEPSKESEPETPLTFFSRFRTYFYAQYQEKIEKDKITEEDQVMYNAIDIVEVLFRKRMRILLKRVEMGYFDPELEE